MYMASVYTNAPPTEIIKNHLAITELLLNILSILQACTERFIVIQSRGHPNVMLCNGMFIDHMIKYEITDTFVCQKLR